MRELSELEDILGIKFKDPSLLEQALVHKSYINENPDFPLPFNERLEFLGDAVLDFFVSKRLYLISPPLSEGKMTKLRSALVCRDTLSKIAKEIKLGEFLRLGKGEEATGGRERASNLSGALEAIIGAVYLDQGAEAAEALIWKLLGNVWELALSGKLPPDYKSELQEFLQARGLPRPQYNLIKTEGPDHARKFTVEVSVMGKTLGKGEGKSKKKAEKEAAHSALIALSQGEVI